MNSFVKNSKITKSGDKNITLSHVRGEGDEKYELFLGVIVETLASLAAQQTTADHLLE